MSLEVAGQPMPHPRARRGNRWHVMRELLGLDVRAALPHLRRMASADPHPDARGAADAVLARAEGAVADRKAA